MPLRLIQAVGPTADVERIGEHLEGYGVLGSWTAPADAGQSVAHILLPAEQTETVTDRLTERFGESEGFRLLVLGVEATLPAAESEAPPEAGAAPAAEPAEAPPERVSREELYQDVLESARVSHTFLVTVVLSTVVAAVGLIRGDVAVIIGAMVIAPLLAPNVALSLASALGDGHLARVAARANALGASLSLALALLLGLLLSVDPQVPELLSRTRVGLGDVALALAAGSAGTLAYTSGLPASIVGVMVAVALLPPLVAAGLLAGSGNTALAGGAFTLALTNVACVNLAGIATFLAQKVRPRSWWEAERARRASLRAGLSWLVLLALLILLILLQA